MVAKALEVDVRDKDRIMSAAEAVSGDHDKAVWWLCQPLAAFAGKTALELVAEGRTDDVIGYLQSCESGYVG
jgi:Protein of unknown function (DUF2384)